MSIWDAYKDMEGIGSTAGAAGLFGGLFGHSGKPYQSAEDAYKEYADRAAAAQQPYMTARS